MYCFCQHLSWQVQVLCSSRDILLKLNSDKVWMSELNFSKSSTVSVFVHDCMLVNVALWNSTKIGINVSLEFYRHLSVFSCNGSRVVWVISRNLRNFTHRQTLKWIMDHSCWHSCKFLKQAIMWFIILTHCINFKACVALAERAIDFKWLIWNVNGSFQNIWLEEAQDMWRCYVSCCLSAGRTVATIQQHISTGF